MKLALRITLLLLLLSNQMNGQHTEWSLNPKAGFVHSNVFGYHTYNDHNQWKTGYMFGVEVNASFWKRIEVVNELSFQARRPLDVFVFWYNQPSFINQVISTSGYPVTKGMLPKGFEQEQVGIFHDFQYIYFSSCPTVVIGNRFQVQIGAGGFYGELINQNQTEVTVDDLRLLADAFKAGGTIVNTNSYTEYDGGWKGVLKFKAQIKPHFFVFINAEYWHSLTRLNDFPLGLFGDIKHKAYVGSVGISFVLQ